MFSKLVFQIKVQIFIKKAVKNQNNDFFIALNYFYIKLGNSYESFCIIC